MGSKLTKAQVRLLRRGERGRLGGFIIFDGREANTAESLERRGLIQTALPGGLATHRITPAGRAALAEASRDA